MPPKGKLCLPPGGKWKSAHSYFQSKPKPTTEEQLAELAAVLEKRKLRAKEAGGRTVLVLTQLGTSIDAAAGSVQSPVPPAAPLSRCGQY